MLTEKEIILAAKEAGFLVYEDEEKMVLSPGLTKFARLIEQMTRTPSAQRQGVGSTLPPSGPMAA